MIDIQKFVRSLSFAYEGFLSLIKSENNARIHLVATICVIVTGALFNISAFEWFWIGLAMVWICEAFNTALETMVDLVSPEKNPLAKNIKDISAAAVLFASIFAVFVAVKVFVF
jgi:diacylglycerol kinase